MTAFPVLPDVACKDSGLAAGGQADDAAATLPSPLVEEGGARSAPDEVSLSAGTTGSLPGGERPLTRPRCFASRPPSPARGEGKSYAEAVVTPPSTTIVCPVMKVEASEAR